MPLYRGQISQKRSADHRTGVTRETNGVTDDKSLAVAFGLTPPKGSATYSNGKVKMTEIFPQNGDEQVAVDMEDLVQIDELTFIRTYIRQVIDFTALTRYMEEAHHSELASKLADLEKTAQLKNLNNVQLEVLCRYFFGDYDKEAARQLIGDSADEEEAFNDIIGRNVFGRGRSIRFHVNGIDYSGYVKLAHYTIGAKTVEIEYVLDKSDVEGNKGVLGKKYANEKAQLAYFKKVAEPDSLSLKITRVYRHNLNVPRHTAVLANRIVGDLKDKIDDDIAEIIKQIRNVFSQIVPADAGLDEFTDFIPTVVWKRLINDLQLTASEFAWRQKGLEDEDLKKYADGKITPQEYLGGPAKDFFVEKFHNVLKKRFKADEVSQEAYAERAIDLAGDDFIGVPRDELMETAIKLAGIAMNEYSADILANTNVYELYELYKTKNHTHDRRIIDRITDGLRHRVAQIKADAHAELKPQVEAELRKALSATADRQFESWLQSHPHAKSSALNIVYVNKVFEERLSEFYEKMPQVNDKNFKERIDTYIRATEKQRATDYYNSAEVDEAETTPAQFRHAFARYLRDSYEEFFDAKGVSAEKLLDFGIDVNTFIEPKIDDEGYYKYFVGDYAEENGEDMNMFFNDSLEDELTREKQTKLPQKFDSAFEIGVEKIYDEMREDDQLKPHVKDWKELSYQHIPDAVSVILHEMSVADFLVKYGVNI